MMKSPRLVLGLLVTIVAPSLHAAEPRRELGLSAHMLPQRVAALDKSGRVKWGFVISLPEDNRAPIDKPVAQSANSLVAALRQQPVGIQQNGIWLVVTNPAAYSDAEKSIVEDLKQVCKKENIALFICRGAELPNGWKRFSSRASRLPYVGSNQALKLTAARRAFTFQMTKSVSVGAILSLGGGSSALSR